MYPDFRLGMDVKVCMCTVSLLYEWKQAHSSKLYHRKCALITLEWNEVQEYLNSTYNISLLHHEHKNFVGILLKEFRQPQDMLITKG